MSGASRTGNRRLAAYITLVRLPNLFTAPPDIVLGAALAAGIGNIGAVSSAAAAGLAIASMLLYAAGTTLNDYFDAPEDVKTRPERPIPSGEVSRQTALVLGMALLAVGGLVAFAAAGRPGGIVAALLALTIVLYDSVFKGGAIGFLFMGAARGLNVVLGTTAGVDPLALGPRTLTVPAVILVYIAGVTYMAEGETGGSTRRAVIVAIGGTALAALVVLGRLLMGTPTLADAVLALVLTTGFLFWTGRELRDAYVNPVPDTVGRAVGACVLGLVVLNAALAATVDAIWALVAAVFFIPAVGLSRIIDVT